MSFHSITFGLKKYFLKGDVPTRLLYKFENLMYADKTKTYEIIIAFCPRILYKCTSFRK
jgi:hypothetical protein